MKYHLVTNKFGLEIKKFCYKITFFFFNYDPFYVRNKFYFCDVLCQKRFYSQYLNQKHENMKRIYVSFHDDKSLVYNVTSD